MNTPDDEEARLAPLRAAGRQGKAGAGASFEDLLGDGGDSDDPGHAGDGSAPDIRAEIERLAGLADLAYERERIAAAKRLGMRTGVLDKERDTRRSRQDRPVDDGGHGDGHGDGGLETLDPWPDRVDGLALADAINGRLRAHVVFGGGADPDLVTLWILGSYFMDTWRLWPRLMVNSPTKMCGKSTLLEVIDALARRGLMASNASPAAIFRGIETFKPTLILDEADTWMKQSEELTGILNSGHTRRTARVMRVVEKAGELIPTVFSTWAAMAIAGIGAQRDTLTSRSIVIALRRRLPGEVVTRLPVDLHEMCAPLRRQAMRWTGDHAIALGASGAEPPACGDDRRRDNFTPLWRIAEALGGPWPERIARAYAAQASEDEDEGPAGVMLLRDLDAIFAERRLARLPTSEIVALLAAAEDRPWSDWRHGKPINGHGLARLLKPFGIRPKNVKLTGGKVLKSYFHAAVTEALIRYVPSCPGNPPSEPLPRYRVETIDEIGKSNRYPDPGGSGSETGIPQLDQAGSGVADRNGGSGWSTRL